MPTYDYTCEACYYCFEQFQKITDKPVKTCPKCKKDRLKQGIGGGAATFCFKGSGFYITDCKEKRPASEVNPSKEKKS